jgi:hypothetical protein
VALTWWKELFRWGSTTPVVGLNDTNHASEQWGSLAPQVVPIEANIHLLMVMQVLPLYSQVVIRDRDSSDLPEWVTGNENFVSTTHAVYVATSNDVAGDVTVRVGSELDAPSMHTIFEGVLDFETGDLECGNIPAGHLKHISLGVTGKQKVEISVDDVTTPRVVQASLLGADGPEDT